MKNSYSYGMGKIYLQNTALYARLSHIPQII